MGIIVGLIVMFSVFVGAFELLAMLERATSRPRTVNVNMANPIAPFVDVESEPEKNVALQQKTLTKEEKAKSLR